MVVNLLTLFSIPAGSLQRQDLLEMIPTAAILTMVDLRVLRIVDLFDRRLSHRVTVRRHQR
jgi:hypothetical protein